MAKAKIETDLSKMKNIIQTYTDLMESIVLTPDQVHEILEADKVDLDKIKVIDGDNNGEH